MKLLCKLFGHKWYFPDDIYETLICKRCGIKVEDYWDKQFHIQDFSYSDLDESENVRGEE